MVTLREVETFLVVLALVVLCVIMGGLFATGFVSGVLVCFVAFVRGRL